MSEQSDNSGYILLVLIVIALALLSSGDEAKKHREEMEKKIDRIEKTVVPTTKGATAK